jgi:hypothetical protein
MMNNGWTRVLIARQHPVYPGGLKSNRICRYVATALLALVSAGCADASPLFLSSGPTPRVEDCMTLQQATPTKYVCDGKTYTSLQLADIRKGTNDKKQ